MHHARLVASLVLTGLMGSTGWTAGSAAFGNEVVSARAMGQGAVGVAAQNDDPAAVYMNPAGLTQMTGTQASLGLAWENLHGTYTNDSGDITKMRSLDAVVPNVAFTHRFLDGKMGTGLALESPYGLETHWPGDSALRYVATNSRLHILTLSPAIAYQIHPMVSIGAGGDYFNAFDASLEKHLSVDAVNSNPALIAQFGNPVLGAADANARFSGSGTNWGYHAGVLIQPNEQHAVGIVYHSKVKLTIDGTVSLHGLSGAVANVFGGTDYQTSAFTDLFIPQNIQFGYAYKPNSHWMIEADTAWYDWYSNRDQNVRYAETSVARLAILTNNGSGNPVPENRRNSWAFATGANYKHSERLQFRGGFFYLPYATPESTFSPSLLDLSRYGLGTGIGIGLTPSLTLDLAYTAVFYHNRQITNTVATDTTGIPANLPGGTIDGTYKNFTNVVNVSLTYRVP